MRVLFLMVDVPRMVLSLTAAGLILSLAVAVPKTVPRMVLSPTLAGPKGFWAWEEGLPSLSYPYAASYCQHRIFFFWASFCELIFLFFCLSLSGGGEGAGLESIVDGL